MPNKKTIHILLATYNGARFLKLQFESIKSQTYKDWILLVRDDCSKDNTRDIIQEFCEIDDRIRFIDSKGSNLGACLNFGNLMQHATNASYVMFCDQDDIWMPNKVEMTLRKMEGLEGEFGRDRPLLVYGTYKMINQDGEPISLPSPDYSTKPDLQLLLSQNYIYGCTMMINNAILTPATPVPNEAENHDYWIALVASLLYAKIGYIDEPLLLYRQHDKNVSGSYKDASFSNRIKRVFSREEPIAIMQRLKMFNALQKRASELKLDTNFLERFIAKTSAGGIKAFVFSVTNGIRRAGRLQTYLFYFNLLRTKKISNG